MKEKSKEPTAEFKDSGQGTFKKIIKYSIPCICSALCILAACFAGTPHNKSGITEKEEKVQIEQETETTESAEETGNEEAPVNSTWQEINGYTWQDLYTILAEIERSSPYLDGNVPAFAIVRISEETDPFLIIGSHPEGTVAGEYHLYITAGTRVYELLSFEGTICWDQDKNSFCIPEEGKTYRYVPHILLSAPADENDEITEIAVKDLSDFYLVSDTIEDYVQEPAGEHR